MGLGIDQARKNWTTWLRPAHGLVLLVSWQLWLTVAHSPWRDELQAYLLVRDSPGLAGLFADLHYEGHPSLWYLLLGAIQAVVPSPVALKVAQAAISLGTTFLVWRYAPFPAWLKLLILAGYYPLFEYGVVARSYGLGAFLLFAWLPLRRTPWGWLTLALMANVAVHFALLSGVCVAAGLWIERRWSWPGAAIWGVGCLATAATIAPAPDVRTGLDLLAEPLWTRIVHALRWQSATLYPALVGVWPYRWQVLLSPPEAPELAATVGAASGLIAAWAVWRQPRGGVLAFGLFLALTALSALVYPTYPRHVGVMALLLVALEWMRLETRDQAPPPAAPSTASPVFITWTAVSAACGLWAALSALWIPFSPGLQEIRWIKAHNLQSATWAAYPGYVGSDISAHLNRPTYNLQKRCLNTFIRWDLHAYDDVDDDVLAERIEDPGPFGYLISDQDLAPLDDPMHLIAHFDRGLGDNDVFLYAMDRPEIGRAMPCR